MMSRVYRLDLTPASLLELVSALRAEGAPFLLAAPGRWDRPADAARLLLELNARAFRSGPEGSRAWMVDALRYVSAGVPVHERTTDLRQLTRTVCDLAVQIGALPAGYADLLRPPVTLTPGGLGPDDLLAWLAGRAFRDGRHALLHLNFPSAGNAALLLPTAALPGEAVPV